MAQAEQVFLAEQSDGRHRHLSGVEAPSAAVRSAQLTGRDLDVLRLLAEGCSTAGIANHMAYSESTIKNVIHDIVRRLGARNRAHAVALAIRAGAI